MKKIIARLYRLYKHIRMDTKATAVLLALCIMTAAVHVGGSLFIEPMIDDSIRARAIAWPQTSAFICCLMASILLRFLLKMHISVICCNCELSWNKLAIKWICTNNMRLLEDRGEGEVVILAGKRISSLKDFLEKNLRLLLYSPLNFLFTFAGILFVDFRTGAIIIPIIVIGVLIDTKLSDRLIRSSDIAYDAENDVASFQKEAIENREDIYLSRLTEYVIDKHHDKVMKLLRANDQLTKEQQFSYIPSLINEYLPKIALVAIAAYKILHGGMEYGAFLALLSLISGASLPFAHFLQSLTNLKAAEPLFDDLDKILSEAKDNPVPDQDYPFDPMAIVSVRDLSFQYKSAEQEVLSGITLDVSRGEKIAIIGRSGCGKTTLLKLLLGMFTAERGGIRLFQQAVGPNKEKLWDRIGYVDNNCYLFDGTVLYNITLSEAPLSKNDRNYLEEICAKLDISDLLACPTPIYQFGNDLSGGQRLKICLARALYRRPELFILDEPSASFDEASENALCEIMKDEKVTAIITTHRDSLLKICGKVFTLDAGSLAQVESTKRSVTV